MKVETKVIEQTTVAYSQEDLREQLLWQRGGTVRPLPEDCIFAWADGCLMASFAVGTTTESEPDAPMGQPTNGKRTRKRKPRRRPPQDLIQIQWDILALLSKGKLSDAQIQDGLGLAVDHPVVHARNASKVRAHRRRLQKWGYVQEVGQAQGATRQVLLWGLTTRGQLTAERREKEGDVF